MRTTTIRTSHVGRVHRARAMALGMVLLALSAGDSAETNLPAEPLPATRDLLQLTPAPLSASVPLTSTAPRAPEHEALFVLPSVDPCPVWMTRWCCRARPRTAPPSSRCPGPMASTSSSACGDTTGGRLRINNEPARGNDAGRPLLYR